MRTTAHGQRLGWVEGNADERGADHPWRLQMQFAGPKWKANRRQTAIRSRIGARKQLNSVTGANIVSAK